MEGGGYNADVHKDQGAGIINHLDKTMPDLHRMSLVVVTRSYCSVEIDMIRSGT